MSNRPDNMNYAQRENLLAACVLACDIHQIYRVLLEELTLPEWNALINMMTEENA